MKTKKIYWKEYIHMIEKDIETENYEIDFKNEKINFKDAAFLNRNGVRVPDNLINYNDDEIDFSDDPDLTDEEINKIHLSLKFAETLPVEPEIKEWIKKEGIDVNTLAAQLIRNFYETVKNIRKNAAL